MSTNANKITVTQVVRESFWPVLFLFAIPIIGIIVASSGTRRGDKIFSDAVVPQIENSDLPPEEREADLRFVHMYPPSYACTHPSEVSPAYLANIKPWCDDNWQFQLAAKLSWAGIGMGLLALFISLISIVVGSRIKSLQYQAFIGGWHSLRLLSTALLVLLTALATWLSFWITALVFNVYIIKLIILVAFFGLFAVGAALIAIFRKPKNPFVVKGALINEARAPRLFERVRELCARLKTNPPDHIIAGIDDNFFVTQAPVHLDEQELNGRTLFISLALLRVLRQDEADSILAHEMAHFAGGDTVFSSRLAPALLKANVYLNALSAQPFAWPVFRLLVAYRTLFEFSFATRQREREFAADAAAASLVSPEAAARALLRTNAYSSYRTRVEKALFDQNAEHDSLGIHARVLSGFVPYVQSDNLHEDLTHAVSPHPFDSHPILAERLAALSASITTASYAPILLEEIGSSWCDAIEGCDEIEKAQWSHYEEQFAKVHQFVLTHRYLPSTDAEKALVEKHFPALSFELNGDSNGVAMDYASIKIPNHDERIILADILSAKLGEATALGQDLVLFVAAGSGENTVKIKVSKMPDRGTPFLDKFSAYWGRARDAKKYVESTKSSAAV